MHPKFKISKVINLQDARYCAAVGFHFVSFSLARGDQKKLPPTLIWNMANWLEGPEIILELNAQSWDELKEVTFDYRYLALPLEDWEPGATTQADAFILTTSTPPSPESLQTLLDENTDVEIKFELTFSDITDALAYQALFPHILLNFTSLDLYFDFFQQKHSVMPWGVSLQTEAEEEPDLLDYERMDDLMAIFSDVHL